ncbi:hypothetical protein CR513_33080, partial [Mucuna pruriens]
MELNSRLPLWRTHKATGKQRPPIGRAWLSDSKLQSIKYIDLLDKRKETLVMVLGQWLFMSHDRRKRFMFQDLRSKTKDGLHLETPYELWKDK